MRRGLKFALSFLILSCVFFSILQAQNFKGQEEKLEFSLPLSELLPEETLEYRVEWLGVTMGSVVLKVHGLEKINHRDCYHIVAKASANRMLRKIIDLEYEVHTFIDKESFFSRRFEKKRVLNQEYSFTEIDFDPENNTARLKTSGSGRGLKVSGLRAIVGKQVPDTEKILPGTQDLLSSLYYLRHLPLAENQSYAVNIYYARKNWQFNFQTGKPFRKDLRKLGSFVVFGISPISALNDFILGKRKFSLILTADSRRIPLEFKFNTGVGTIRAVIQKIP
jgi:hypothetical protein